MYLVAPSRRWREETRRTGSPDERPRGDDGERWRNRCERSRGAPDAPCGRVPPALLVVPRGLLAVLHGGGRTEYRGIIVQPSV